MLDMIKFVSQEAQKQCRQLTASGIEVDENWMEGLKDDQFCDQMNILLEKATFEALPLMSTVIACFEKDSPNTAVEWLEAIYQHSLFLVYPSVGIESVFGAIGPKARVFLALFRNFHRLSLKINTTAFLARFPFQLLKHDAIEALENPTEYNEVVKAFEQDYIYEMMVLNHEIKGYSTVDHIAGVHYLAMFIAEQIKAKGIPIDLGLVSGAAALHDIGKFGCLPDEVKKVAYYHYYYSDLWFRERKITYIRQIAVNHSTWDLELSYLPIESLVLIYADFRVKGHADPDWPFPMKFFDLATSFHVILEKLDDVDATKELRYRKVYEKLQDFERYLEVSGIKTAFDLGSTERESAHQFMAQQSKELPTWVTKDASLLSSQEVILKYKTMAVSYNIEAMHAFRHEVSLREFLYEAQNQNNAHGLRRYVHLMTQFSRYVTEGQKRQMVDFLYALFLHPEGDLRKQAAESMGTIIATFDAPYSKYLPPSAPETTFKASKSFVLKPYCEAFLGTEDKTSLKIERIGIAMVQVFRTLLTHAKEPEASLNLLISQLRLSEFRESAYYLKVLLNINLRLFNSSQIESLISCIFAFLKSSEEEVQIDAQLSLNRLYKSNEAIVLNILQLKGYENWSLQEPRRVPNLSGHDSLVQMYLQNSQMTTPSEIKKRNIAHLLTYVLKTAHSEVFYAAIHCCNLLKNNTSQDVRLSAAKSLVVLDSRLTDTERNEVVMELMRGLEIDHYAFTKYMPQTLGRIIIRLNPILLGELLQELTDKLKQGSEPLRVLIIETIAHAINAGIVFQTRHKTADIPLEKMFGMLLIGLVQSVESVHLAAFQALTVTVLDSHLTSLAHKGSAFVRYAKKMLCLIGDDEKQHERAVAYAFGFSHLYGFLSDYAHGCGELQFKQTSAVAFFQGAFDPISLGQKGVVQKLLSEGVDVYVALDAFCWNRRTQPTRLRRKLIQLTLADLSDVFVLPRDFSINYSLPSDLDKLATLLPSDQIYLVMGEDALVSQEVYRLHIENVANWPHFIMKRGNLSKKNQEVLKRVVEQLAFPTYLKEMGEIERITPDHVRRGIDRQLDLRDVLDPLATTCIEEFHMYKNEPQFKSSLERKFIDVMNLEMMTDQLRLEIWNKFHVDFHKKSDPLSVDNPTYRNILIRERANAELIGIGAYRRLSQAEHELIASDKTMKRDYSDLYQENTAMIECLHNSNANWMDEYTFTLQTELMVDAMNQGYDYILFSAASGMIASDVLEALRSMGFVEIPSLRLLLVSLKAPIVLMLDAQTMLKEDYRQIEILRTTIKEMRLKLLQSLVKSYPRQVILPFDRGMLYDRLIHLVSEANDEKQANGYGPFLVVPYGDLFKRWTLPNSITKALHTERVYDNTLSYFTVEASPYHLPLTEQIKLLKSYNQPLILVDDLLDKGLRLQAIEHDLHQVGIQIESIVVGIMSGLGKRRLEQKGYKVIGGYEVSNLQGWYTESMLYPFVGGDAHGEKQKVSHGVLEVVNRILPYFTAPEAKGMAIEAYLNLSLQCLKNATQLMRALETHYYERHHRPLTVERLSEVFITPRMPHYGEGVEMKQDALPSFQLQNDMIRVEQLLRLVLKSI